MIAKKIPGFRADFESIDGLLEYIEKPETSDRREKCVHSLNYNLPENKSHKRLASEILALARGGGNLRKRRLVDHWVLSWHELEKPSLEIMDESVLMFLDRMGFRQHQAVAGVHINTENLHAHIAVSRIDPGTSKILVDSNDFIRAQKALAEIEWRTGAQPERNSRFLWNSLKGVIKNPDYVKNNSIDIKFGSPDPVIVRILEKGFVPEIPGLIRKENIYLKKCCQEASAILENDILYCLNWMYRDFVNYLMELKDRKLCVIETRHDFAGFFMKNPDYRARKAYVEGTFADGVLDVFTGRDSAPVPGEPFLEIRKKYPELPKKIISLKIERKDSFLFYGKLKRSFMFRVPFMKTQAVAALAMRSAAVPRTEIENALLRDGMSREIARHLCRWLYTDNAGMELFRLQAQGIIKPFQKSAVIAQKVSKKSLFMPWRFDRSGRLGFGTRRKISPFASRFWDRPRNLPAKAARESALLPKPELKSALMMRSGE